MRKIGIVGGFFFLILIFLTPVTAFAQTDIPAEALPFFDCVNDVRVENKKEPLIYDANLSVAANRHALYLSEIKRITEQGPNKETLKQRVLESGYGGSQSFNVAQIMAMGHADTTAAYFTQSVWLKNTLSIQKLLYSRDTHIGIGVVTVERQKFVVLIFAHTSDDVGTQTPMPRSLSSVTPTAKTIKTAVRAVDGSVMHPVESGETFSEIAAIYGLDWATLAEQNQLNLENPVIFMGKDLLIYPAFTLTPTPTSTNTPRPPTRTPRPTFTSFNGDGIHATETVSVRTVPKITYIFFNYGLSVQNIVGLVLIMLSVIGLLIALYYSIRKK